MKKVTMFFMVLFALASTTTFAQCTLPNDVQYQSNTDKVKWTESDRSAIYTITWGAFSMTQKIGMFGGGQGKVNLQFEAGNTNNPSVYLFGGIQNGDVVTISKWCNGSPSVISTFTVQ